jgi:hypothetical protein
VLGVLLKRRVLPTVVKLVIVEARTFLTLLSDENRSRDAGSCRLVLTCEEAWISVCTPRIYRVASCQAEIAWIVGL